MTMMSFMSYEFGNYIFHIYGDIEEAAEYFISLVILALVVTTQIPAWPTNYHHSGPYPHNTDNYSDW